MAADQSNREAPELLLRLLRSAAAHHSGGDLEKAEEGYLRLLDHGYREADILLPVSYTHLTLPTIYSV